MRRTVPSLIALCLIAVPAAFAASAEFAPTHADVQLVTAELGDAPFAVPIARQRRERRVARVAARRRRAKLFAGVRAPAVAIPPQLEAIAACESGGDTGAIGGGGLYRGKYQFSNETWRAVGGIGDPAAAPELEQDRRAAILYAQSGPGQWPVCGQ